MLRFEVDVTAADDVSREITGVAVPYGEVATLGDHEYQFTEGSLRPARARTPLLLGHDTNRPVGVLMGIEDTAGGAVARFKIDRGPEGDLALEQAQSGSRSGLSIGATIVAAEDATDGVRVVTQASLMEVSLCAIPAFAGASVTSVTAEASDPETPEEPEEAQVEEKHQEEAPEPVAAEQPSTITVTAERPRKPLTTSEFIMASAAAQRGDVRAQEIVRAALDVVETGDVPGVLPDAMTQQVIGLIPTIRTLADNVRRAPLPATGLKVVKPLAGTLPNGSNIDYNDPAPTNTPTVTTHEVDVVEWAYGVAVSASVMERSAPDFAEYLFGQIVADYYRDVESALASAIDGAANTATNVGVGAAIGQLYGQCNQPADLIVAAPDVFGYWLDETGWMKWSEGSVSGAMSGSIMGVRVVTSPYLNAGSAYVAARNNIELRESNPMRLTATNIGALQMELGVVSFYTIDVENEDAVLKINLD